ncbi:MAG: flavodoxin family protein [Syntrophorhabdaceae bacterium]|nr:flavodoxin family protein [Syntrophorhabdaceae bacterium]
MKLLGLSAGRKMGNGEILLKEALMAAKEIGDIDVEMVRFFDLEINPCTGCEGCTQSLSKGGTGECVRWNDDMLWLKDRLWECDGLILSSPVFELRPSGNYCSMNDRFLGFGPRFLMGVFEKKKRVGAAIATGGSDWVQLALPQMMVALFMLNIKVVDKYVATWVARPGHVLLRDDHMARARKLGLNVASAMKKPVEEVEYMGDEPGACPYCHSDLVVMMKKATVECPICGIKGMVSITNGEFNIAWSEEDLKHIRWEPLGMGSHFKDIRETHGKFEAAKDVVQDRLKKYREFTPYVKPESKGGKKNKKRA